MKRGLLSTLLCCAARVRAAPPDPNLRCFSKTLDWSTAALPLPLPFHTRSCDLGVPGLDFFFFGSQIVRDLIDKQRGLLGKDVLCEVILRSKTSIRINFQPLVKFLVPCLSLRASMTCESLDLGLWVSADRFGV